MFVREYTATSKIGADRTFWCLACDFKCPALCLGVGSASTETPGLGHNESAAYAVAFDANAAAEENARQVFGLVPCPKCGATDPTAMRRFRLGAAARILGAGVVGAVAGAVVGTLGMPFGTQDAGLIGAIIGAVIGMVLIFIERWIELSGLRGQAKLFPDQAPSNDLTRL